MTNRSKPPSVFISYCWEPDDHPKWVLNLAEKLKSDNVNVIIDKWNLKPGHDVYAFMETLVSDPEITKVLIICNKQYSHKANQRKGGVGVESQIISGEVYGRVDQEKFIPIVAELDPDGKPYLPVYLKSRMYINLSSEKNFNDEYQNLLSCIFDNPSEYAKAYCGGHHSNEKTTEKSSKKSVEESQGLSFNQQVSTNNGLNIGINHGPISIPLNPEKKF